jgi:uncharacterized protein
MSHRGSILCLPLGIWASGAKAADEIALATVSLALSDDAGIDHFLIGTGKEPFLLPQDLGDAFRSRRVVLEAMTTGAAVRTYNILLGERRRIGALLIAVD